MTIPNLFIWDSPPLPSLWEDICSLLLTGFLIFILKPQHCLVDCLLLLLTNANQVEVHSRWNLKLTSRNYLLSTVETSEVNHELAPSYDSFPVFIGVIPASQRTYLPRKKTISCQAYNKKNVGREIATKNPCSDKFACVIRLVFT